MLDDVGRLPCFYYLFSMHIFAEIKLLLMIHPEIMLVLSEQVDT